MKDKDASRTRFIPIGFPQSLHKKDSYYKIKTFDNSTNIEKNILSNNNIFLYNTQIDFNYDIYQVTSRTTFSLTRHTTM